jgi:hypothetical protein
MMEVVLVLATMGQRFRFSLETDQSIDLLPAMSLRPKGEINVTIHSRRGLREQ